MCTRVENNVDPLGPSGASGRYLPPLPLALNCANRKMFEATLRAVNEDITCELFLNVLDDIRTA